MEQSDSDKLQPPSLDGVFARKRRERQEREVNPQWVEPYAAPAPPTPQPTPPPPAAPLPETTRTVEPAEESEHVQPVPVAVKPEVAEPEPVALQDEDHGSCISETAVLARVSEEPGATEPTRAPRQKVAKAPKEPKAAKEAKTPKAPKPEKAVRTRRIPAFIPTIVAGACSGGVLVGLVAAFNRWGGQTDSINAVELLGSFVAAIVAGFILLVLGRVKHGAAISFLGVGLVAVVLMFFPSDRWQTVTGGIIVVVATAVAYVAAHRIAREATSN